jgi:hypothetical protein
MYIIYNTLSFLKILLFLGKNIKALQQNAKGLEIVWLPHWTGSGLLI